MDLIERVKNILLQPKEAWAAIDTETTDVATLFTRYALILAAIPAVCGFIGMSLIGFGGFGFTVRLPFVSGLVSMVVSYALSLAMLFVLGLIIDALAPMFGGKKNPIQALKVAVYASTAAMLGGIFNMLPPLALLGMVAALYSIYLLYLGLPVLMKSAPEKSVVYTVVVIVAAIVMSVLIATLSSLVVPHGGAMLGGADVPAITMNTPNGKVTIDTARLEEAGKQVEEAARQVEEAKKSQDPAAIAAATSNAAKAAAGMFGGGQAVAAQSLKAALPETLAGMPRTGFDVQDGAALGLPTSQASAQYSRDDKMVRLEIVDIGGLGKMAMMGMVQGEKEDQASAEKTWQEGGRTLHTRYEKDGSHAEFKTILKNGLVVSIEGDNVDIKALQGLMSQVDLNGLEGLQRKGKS
ncbi:Yip1 family protein [Acidovorax sp.]|uniref:Yip1 family protein n=1 Tax=Acidovorax sp. TaxID=1872122 RepID=UPI0026345BB4|nr:Yip1 family protein [Acidovorax sp.]